MFINGLKYACSTCIKGHRSSHCSHVDRPLFEIRKKGRPVTQCTFCRDLRKTKQVHIKCACSDKKASSSNATPTTLTNATTTSSITNAEGQSILIHRNNSITSNHSNSSTSKCNSDDPCQDKSKKSISQQCTCPHTANHQGQKASSIKVKQSPTTTTVTTSTQSYFPQVNVTQDACTQMDVTQDSNLSLLAPLCNTPPPPPLVKEENLSYSWALITSPSANQIDLPSSSAAITSNNNNNFFSDMLIDNNNNDSNNLQHLGFIFHKPTSTQRFLDGQPRVRRRRSTNQKRINAANSATVTPTNYNNNSGNRLPVNALMDAVLTIDTLGQDYNLSTPPSSAVSPHQVSSSASSAAMEPMDMQFDYLTEQLEILSSTSNHNNNNNNNCDNSGYMGDLANADELTAILNNVLQKDDDDLSLPSSSSYAGSIVDPVSNNQSPTTATTTTPITPTIASKRKSSSSHPSPLSPMNRSHCGSFVPRSKCCKPAGAVGGESVVITITPLTNATNDDNANKSMMMMLEDDQTQQKTTTRIVTCYCGSQCTCPGCLVHPGNFFLGSDPYAGLMMNPSSSASSSCYGSDEEDMSSMYGRNENFMTF